MRIQRERRGEGAHRLEAIVRSHPNRENALDRLLADVSEDDATAIAAERARAEYDMSIDNDFDGMG